METIFLCSVKSVLTIILAALPGFLLVRYKVLTSDALRIIGRIVVFAALPSLLATKLAASINFKEISRLWIFPVSGVIMIFGAYIIARFANLFIREKSEIKGVLYTASSLGNAAYLPIPLIIAICAVFPEFADDSGASARGIAFISSFLIAFSPLSWIFGYNTISDKGHKFELRYFFPPPVIGIIIGITIGMIPWFKKSICLPTGFFYPAFEAAKIIAAAAIPLAMIVLGGRFALPQHDVRVPKKIITATALIKLLLLPVIVIFYVFFLRKSGIISKDPMIALILIIEAAVPPANNLILMASMHKSNEYATAKVLFICYLISTISLTLFIAVAMALFA